MAGVKRLLDEVKSYGLEKRLQAALIKVIRGIDPYGASMERTTLDMAPCSAPSLRRSRAPSSA